MSKAFDSIKQGLDEALVFSKGKKLRPLFMSFLRLMLKTSGIK